MKIVVMILILISLIGCHQSAIITTIQCQPYDLLFVQLKNGKCGVCYKGRCEAGGLIFDCSELDRFIAEGEASCSE